MDELKKKITDAVNTTGYPLELYVSSILKKHGENPFANEYFFDFDGNQARSIDIHIPAFQFFKLGKTKVPCGVDIAIECKKSPKTAWIFFEDDEVVLTEYIGQITDYQQYSTGNYELPNNLKKFDQSISLHYGTDKVISKIAVNYQVVKFGDMDLDESTKNIKTKDTIFEAINQVIKYVSYSKKMLHENISRRYMTSEIYPLFNIIYPIIVYDGLMYNGFLKNDKIELEECDHFVLRHEFQTNYLSQPKTFYIDVVRKEYFEKLLQILLKEAETIQKHLDKDVKKFEDHAKSLKLTTSSIKK